MWYNCWHLPISTRILRNAVVPLHIRNHPVLETPAVCPVGSGLCIFRSERLKCFQAAICFSTTHVALWRFLLNGLANRLRFFRISSLVWLRTPFESKRASSRLIHCVQNPASSSFGIPSWIAKSTTNWSCLC